MSVNAITAMRSDIAEMLSKIRDVSSKSTVFSEHATHATHGPNASKNFNDVMSVAKDNIQKVNDMQTQTEGLRNAYLAGDGDISMAQVAVASQKSKLAFEGLIAVRNKVLEAYKEIMNMPV